MARLGLDLLVQAKALANLDKGKPRQASLRRSVSASYYGLFHFLIEESTLLIVGAAASDEKYRRLVARAFVHEKMKTLCKEFVKNPPAKVHDLIEPFLNSSAGGSKASLAKIAQAFVALQEARHAADYDLTKTHSRKYALNCHQQAHDAVLEWNRLKARDREFCRLFALCLSYWPSLASRQ